MDVNRGKAMRQKKDDSTDKYVGRRLRMRRMTLRMSQTNLGDVLGLTFQQIQKYERGASRIGAGRLQQIANSLSVPVSYFFEGGPSDLGPRKAADEPEKLFDFLATSDGLSLVAAFLRIKRSKVRKSVIAMVESIADEYDH
jgi:transcriptional regulator with XRE-family HTH domain